ncbi:hypothetical protein ACFVAV_17905 [Nocardia sp. NPDC057663]|uniref:hypothetical protein n=1 Tax=Nocardia sp. NPDC057663 TaxID=3346201 RepID=UPI00366F5E05
MTTRPAERILDEIVNDKGKGAKLRRKLVAGQEKNWLLALMLNSFAKYDKGLQLTDLEQSLVAEFRANGFSDAEIKQQGRLSLKIPRQLRAELFPEKFAKLDTTQAYSFENLNLDAPDIVKAVLAAPTVNAIDIHAVHSGARTLRDFPPVSGSIRREHASETLVAVDEEASLDTHEAARPKVKIKATSFHCKERATDSVFGPANEPYWIFSTAAGGKSHSHRSQEFKGVDGGESRTFKVGEGILWGFPDPFDNTQSAEQLPSGDIGMMIQLWEHDEGNMNKVRRDVSAAFAGAAKVLKVSGAPAWSVAVVEAAGEVVKYLIGLMDDDHIATQTVVFTREVLEKRLAKANGSFDFRKRFQDGDADYSLTITVTG